ncbi:MAG: hypothetical protein OEV01_11380 [Nitrospira sp.]|nr:hypothetical protein [Nitrospira sp.]
MSRAGIISISLVLVLGLPLLGVLWVGGPLGRYLEFPPRTNYVQHEPFSWPVFIALSIATALAVGPILLRVVSTNFRLSSLITQPSALNPPHSCSSFPWWGWLSLVWTGLWWGIAWTRFPGLSVFQEQTFTPLWLGYIMIVNAVTFSRTGQCMMFHRPRYFLSLFPFSAVLWWTFEYLNRFVQNWYYIGVAELSSIEYLIRATIPFSTVLPAVLGTAELLTSYPSVSAGLDQYKQIYFLQEKRTSWLLLTVACFGLLGIGWWPNYLFPLVWVGPLLLVVSLQRLAGRTTVLSPLVHGDWRGIWVLAFAALVCGFFWELWNWKSLAHWEYAIPFVHRFQLFEMPLLGYAGYLPFGLECAVIAELCLDRQDFIKQTHPVINNGHC